MGAGRVSLAKASELALALVSGRHGDHRSEKEERGRN